MADNGAPPWPGFVDALSTVLMMMVFFTLLMVLVVGTLSYMIAIKDTAVAQGVAEEPVDTVAASESIDYKSLSASEQLKEALTRKAELGEEDLDPKGSVSVLAMEKLEMEKKALQKRLQAALAAAKASEGKNKEDAGAKAALQKALARIAELEASRGKDVELRAGEEKAPPPFITKIVKGMDPRNRIIILYNQLTSTLEDSTKVELLKWIKGNQGAIASNGLELVATLNFEGVSSSTSNSVSFKRLYGLIRVINEEGGIPKSKIKFRALDEAVPGTNQVVIGVGKLPR
ncbi:hypothetical protein [Pseudodesulfovibrio sp.]|uniref:hypothetical protein n=1 Tax=Pseudodesulfovibrio sp. TaxID=2035812 RepID=UPI00261BAB02|nr:hypothetical protein [Pseudodesulfovibrio sp.]MDD3312460.1 hypothetical protein [Pseudodesulfovibrio sp.]